MKNTTAARSRGFTLVELLVALAIGLLLTVGIVQIYLGSKQTYRVQQQLSRMQESGRSAVEIVGRVVRQSGHRSNFDALLLPDIDVFRGRVGLTVAAAGAGDRVTVRFQSDGAMTDCLNRPVAAGDIGVNVLEVRNGALACATVDAPGAGDWTALVDGIEAMSVLLGEDVADNDDVADRYLSPGHAALDAARVVSVRVELTLDNPAAAALEPQPSVIATIALRNRISKDLPG